MTWGTSLLSSSYKRLILKSISVNKPSSMTCLSRTGSHSWNWLGISFMKETWVRLWLMFWMADWLEWELRDITRDRRIADEKLEFLLTIMVAFTMPSCNNDFSWRDKSGRQISCYWLTPGTVGGGGTNCLVKSIRMTLFYTCSVPSSLQCTRIITLKWHFIPLLYHQV